MLTAVLVVAILVLLIVIHELGHFLVAKLTGVRVDEFGVGYPPRAFLLGKIGKTEYTLNWLPLGGFVRLYGDDGSDNHSRGSINGAPRYIQALILVAGVTANIVLAWALFTTSLVIGVPTIVDSAQPGETAQLLITDVVPASPAAGARIEQGDQILLVVDDKGVKLDELTPSAMTDFVKDRGGRKLIVTYRHNDAIATVTMQPANAVVPSAPGRPALGLGLALVANRSFGIFQAMYESYFTTIGVITSTFQVASGILTGLFHGNADVSQLAGPIGLVHYAGTIASQQEFGNLIRLAAVISVNLAVINMIPIPILDGGRLVVLVLEGIRRKKFPALGIQLINGLSLLLLAVLFIAVSYNDILHWVM